MKIDTLLSPAELPALAHRDLRGSACVVFDILRATSTFVTALNNGAEAIIPVSEINEALAIRKNFPGIMLAGEREGRRIYAAQACGVDFDFGNSPREFVPKKIASKTIVSTTTNGTRALRACLGAKIILASSFLNLAATAHFLNQSGAEEILLVCAGTGTGVALEDVLAAGALAELLAAHADVRPTVSDSAEIALRAFMHAQADLPAALAGSQNARRLLAIPELRDDVAFCSQRDIFNLVAEMKPDGIIRRG